LPSAVTSQRNNDKAWPAAPAGRKVRHFGFVRAKHGIRAAPRFNQSMVGTDVVAGLRRWVAQAQLVRAPGETAAAVGQFDLHVVNDAIRGVCPEAAEVI